MALPVPAYRMLTEAKFHLNRESFTKLICPLISSGEPGGTRTRDPMIKSHVLYRLSYGLFQKISRCGNAGTCRSRGRVCRGRSRLGQ
jgi:hypothetical protein